MKKEFILAIVLTACIPVEDKPSGQNIPEPETTLNDQGNATYRSYFTLNHLIDPNYATQGGITHPDELGEISSISLTWYDDSFVLIPDSEITMDVEIASEQQSFYHESDYCAAENVKLALNNKSSHTIVLTCNQVVNCETRSKIKPVGDYPNNFAWYYDLTIDCEYPEPI